MYTSKVGRLLIAVVLSTAISACAGRDAQPVQMVNAWDSNATCVDILTEARAVSYKISNLRREEEDKKTQNVIMGTAGVLLFPPLLLGMDFKDAAGTEREALEARLAYLDQKMAMQCPTVVAALPN